VSGTSAPVGFNPRDVVGGEAGLGTGRLPLWTPYVVTLASVVVVGLGLALTDKFTIFLFVLLSAILSILVLFGISRVTESHRQAKDRLMTSSIAAAFVLALLPLLSLLYTVVSKGLARFDWAFFTESGRNVVGEGGGAVHAIYGTLIITGVATAISVPIGIMAAIYLQEYGKGRLSRYLTFFVDVMTGIPSIVAGLFAYALFAIFLGPGIRLGVIGSVALAVLMIPIVIRSTEEMLKIVPNHLREASYALGTPKWRTITPLLVTAGVVDSINTDPFGGRMQNLAVYAFNEYKSPGVPQDASFDRAWAAALTLILIVLILNLIARLFYRRFGTEIR
jgi:phosphate transport system permease protein